MSSNHQADSVLQSERCNGTKKLEFQQFTDRRVSSNPSLAQEMATAKPCGRVCNSSSGHKWNINVKLRHRIAIYHFGVFYLQLKHHHADTWTPFIGALLLTALVDPASRMVPPVHRWCILMQKKNPPQFFLVDSSLSRPLIRHGNFKLNVHIYFINLFH